MIERINAGDKEALRCFMQTHTKYIYTCAILCLPDADPETLREATRRTLKAIAEAAKEGNCREDVPEWLLELTRSACKTVHPDRVHPDRVHPDRVHPDRTGPVFGSSPSGSAPNIRSKYSPPSAVRTGLPNYGLGVSTAPSTTTAAYMGAARASAEQRQPMQQNAAPRPAMQQQPVRQGVAPAERQQPMQQNAAPRPAMQQPVRQGVAPAEQRQSMQQNATPRAAMQQQPVRQGAAPTERRQPMQQNAAPRAAMQQPVWRGVAPAEQRQPMQQNAAPRPAMQQQPMQQTRRPQQNHYPSPSAAHPGENAPNFGSNPSSVPPMARAKTPPPPSAAHSGGNVSNFGSSPSSMPPVARAKNSPSSVHVGPQDRSVYALQDAEVYARQHGYEKPIQAQAQPQGQAAARPVYQRQNTARPAYQRQNAADRSIYAPPLEEDELPDLFEEESMDHEAARKGRMTPAMAVMIGVLGVVVAVLAWMLVVMLSARNYINAEIGTAFADWFNGNLFMFF